MLFQSVCPCNDQLIMLQCDVDDFLMYLLHVILSVMISLNSYQLYALSGLSSQRYLIQTLYRVRLYERSNWIGVRTIRP